MKITTHGLTGLGFAGMLVTLAAVIPYSAQERSPDCFRSLVVTVTDSDGTAVTELSKGDFGISDNKKSQEIQSFGNQNTPLVVGIIFKSSSYEKSDYITHAKEFLAKFIEMSNARDEFFLVDVKSRPELMIDRTRNGEEVLRNLEHDQDPTGDKAFYDAVDVGLERVARNKGSKQIIILVSDGEDDNSRLSFDKLLRKAKESDATIYAVGVGKYRYTKIGRLNGRRAMKELASLSGGKAYFPNNADGFRDAFGKIDLAARNSYLIGYCPTGVIDDGKWHRLRVKVTSPTDSLRLSAHNRDGYYSVKH